jgi:bifunctional ADP-heptose synthase (sugar kinase/adenylyltransferase)
VKVLVIGDVCRDVYHYGSTKRKNPEASAPLLNDIATEIKYGMAANVAFNLAELGAEVHTNFPPDEQWSVKKRYIDFQYGTQLLRVDHDRPCDPLGQLPDVSAYDAVVVSDYGKGFVSHDILQKLDGKLLVFVDTKKTELDYLSTAWVKINHAERELLKTPPKNLVVTLGAKGSRSANLYAPAWPIEVVDPCGAGDTYLAAFAWHVVREPDNVMGAMEFANTAAAVTCQHRGTYAPTLEEIRR